MRIGIDISQIAFEHTGVAVYVRNIVTALIRRYPDNDYILFAASLRKRHVFAGFIRSLGAVKARVRLVSVPIPPTLLEMLWNRLRILPVTVFTGPLDVFWSSDWTQPPLGSTPVVTTIHDLSILRFPIESRDTVSVEVSSGGIAANIVAVQKRRLKLAARHCSAFFCDSLATKNDAERLLGLDPKRLNVVYPGYTKAV